MSMRVQVLYFAQAATASGVAREHLDIPDGWTLAALQGHLLGAHPQLSPLMPSLLWGVDEQMVSRDHALAEGQVIAVMPPFSGG